MGDHDGDAKRSCGDEDDAVDGPTRRVYVATDDPATVREEIVNLTVAVSYAGGSAGALPAGSNSTIIKLTGNDGEDFCLRLAFAFHPGSDSVSEHLHNRNSKDTCFKRYQRNVAAISDLMILTRADTFVGEYNSNWGRLVRTLRTSFDNNDDVPAKNATTEEWGAVIVRDVVVAWGSNAPKHPGARS